MDYKVDKNILKKINSTIIDAKELQYLGSLVFNYHGEHAVEEQKEYQSLIKSCDDLLSSVQELKDCL